MMDDKPALLSGADSERLGLISINTGEVVMETTRNVGSPAYTLILRRKSTDVTESTNGLNSDVSDEKMNNKRTCMQPNRGTEHATVASHCRSSPPRIQIQIPKSRQLPPTGQLRKGVILREYGETFMGFGRIGPPVHFEVKEDVSPGQCL